MKPSTSFGIVQVSKREPHLTRVLVFVITWNVMSIIYSKQSWGSACCARSSAAPSLILSDDQSQLGLALSHGNVVAQADDEGAAIFGFPNTSEIIRTYRLDGATLLSDRFQVGASVSIVQHSVAQPEILDSTIGAGDTRFSFAYEFLPLWSYSAWKPQGFIFSVITVPTGRSVYEAQAPTSSDVVGNGFYSISVGTILQKRWTNWDVFLMPELHYSLPRTFENSGMVFQVVPGFGGSMGVGGGISPGGSNFRIGSRVQPRIDQSRSIPAIDSESQVQLGTATCDVAFDLSYLFGSSDSLMLSYADQTLLGPAMNSNLSRIFGVNFQHRWER